MSLYVVDASVVAPDLLFAEVGNTLWKKTLRGELTAAESRQLMQNVEHIAVETVPCRDLATDAHALALVTSRSVYDAMYLALAARLETRVVTADERLVNALAAFPRLASYVELLDLTA